MLVALVITAAVLRGARFCGFDAGVLLAAADLAIDLHIPADRLCEIADLV